MKYCIGICDDEIYHVHLIKRYIQEFISADEIEILHSNKPIRFLELIKTTRTHIVFLDIDMKELDGIELGKTIKEFNRDTVIVYVTAYERYAIEAFKTRAFHYLLKPVLEDQLHSVLKEAIKYLSHLNAYTELRDFIIKTKKEIVHLKQSEIIYFEKTGHKIRVCTNNRDIYYYDNFTNLLKSIDGDLFVRCHQGYIVNIDRVTSYCNRTLTLSNELQLPVSRSYAKHVKTVLGNKLFS